MDEYDYQQIMNISSSNTVLKPMIKSQYRGVYRCGKKWKAQMQSNGVQFYLGIYETEIEAAQAYEKKVKESGGHARLRTASGGRRYEGGVVQFEGKSDYGNTYENVDLAQVFMLQHQKHRSYLNHSSPSSSVAGKEREDNGIISDAIYETTTANSIGIADSTVRKLQSTKQHTVTYQNTDMKNADGKRADVSPNPMNPMDGSSGPLLRLMWERFCQISQRIIVAKSSQQLLKQLSERDPSDPEKKQLLAALEEEVDMLATVKGQLEEAVSRCFAREIKMKTTVTSAIAPATNHPAHAVTSSSSSSSSEGEQSNPDERMRRNNKSSSTQIQIHQQPCTESDHGLPKQVLVDTKFQTLKRKAPEQLLVYRNRIGPVGKRGPAAAATTADHGERKPDSKGDFHAMQELTSAATTGLISLSSLKSLKHPQENDQATHHRAAEVAVETQATAYFMKGNSGSDRQMLWDGGRRDSSLPGSSSLQQQPKARK